MTISVPLTKDDPAARELVEALGGTADPPQVYLGGFGCGQDWPEELGATRLDVGVVEAARAMVDSLR
ncbi:hypothetical protein [Ornithinimicrobium sp. W1665]|uniref:hypothetical protein n=1 Tax=Ornithinimicrobium sp. W1665 TaxID=3416666 RepID=UPI003D6B180B